MNLNIVIPITPECDLKEAEECKAIAESIWTEDIDINVLTERGETCQDAFNNSLDRLKEGYVLFTFPRVKLNTFAFSKGEIARSFERSDGLLVFGYEQISWNVPHIRAGSTGNKKTEEYLWDIHGHLADLYYTSVINKIFRVKNIREAGIRFDNTIIEYFELDFILRYIHSCDDAAFFEQTIGTFYSKPGIELSAEQRINDKLKIFDSYEKALNEKCGSQAAKEIMAKERSNYVIYEGGRIGETPFKERRKLKNKLYRGFLPDMDFRSGLVIKLKSGKERISGRLRKISDSIKVSGKEKRKKREIKREKFRKANLKRLRKPGRILHQLFSKRKKILLYCESTTMKSHIFDYYECIKGLDRADIFIYYPGNWDDTVCGKQKLVKSEFKALMTPWDMVVCADVSVPLYYTKDEAVLLYINHGLHMISYDGGESLYAYSGDQSGFTAMFEPNSKYAAILGESIKDTAIIHTGYKNTEKVLQKKNERAALRAKLGITDDTVTVAVFGTWGRDSLFHTVGESLIDQAQKLMQGKYRFILSIHPREYTVYDHAVKPLGEYVDSLSAEGFIVRDPKEPSADYLVAADVVMCDYSTLCEEAMLAEKPVILSEFPDGRVWKQSIIQRYKEKGPIFRNDSSLEELIDQALSDDDLKKYASELVSSLMPPEGGYENAVRHATEELLGGKYR